MNNNGNIATGKLTGVTAEFTEPECVIVFEPTTYNVYAKVDDKNRVTRFFSDCFEQPTDNDFLIKSGSGDEFVHVSYYQVLDENGAYRYKIKGWKMVERTEEERAEDLYPASIEAEINELKDKLDKTDYQTIKRMEKLILEQFYSSLDEETIFNLNERQSCRDKINRLQVEQANLNE